MLGGQGISGDFGGASAQRAFRASRNELGIVCLTYEPNAVVHVAEAHAMVAAIRGLAAGTPCLLLVDARGLMSMSREARVVFDHDSEQNRATALVLDSPLATALGNFWMRLRRSTSPVRLFSTPERATEWLLTQR